MFSNGVRLFLIYVFVPTYRLILRSFVSRNLRTIIVRNSALRRGAYHALLSDLDLAFIGEFTERDARQMRQTHKWLQRALPFLGEVEIYPPAEWARRQHILRVLAPHFDDLRTLRKIRWLSRFLSEKHHWLAKRRAQRGIEKCLIRMGARAESLTLAELRVGRQTALEPFLQRTLDGLVRDWVLPQTAEETIEFYHPWLEADLRSVEDPHATAPYYLVSPKDALILAAIFPIRIYTPEISASIGELRRNPSLRDYLSLFSELEFSMMKASIWGERQVPDWFVSNADDLQHWIAPQEGT